MENDNPKLNQLKRVTTPQINRALVMHDSLEFYQKICEDNFQQLKFCFNNFRQIFSFSTIVFHVTNAIVLCRLSDFKKPLFLASSMRALFSIYMPPQRIFWSDGNPRFILCWVGFEANPRRYGCARSVLGVIAASIDSSFLASFNP